MKHRLAAFLVATTSLLLACAQPAARKSDEAFHTYANSLSPAQPQTIANAVEVTAPRVVTRDDTVYLSSDDASRQVHLRLVDDAQWPDDVKRVYVRTESVTGALSDGPLIESLRAGVDARDAEIHAASSRVIVYLRDVAMSGTDSRPGWLRLVLDFDDRPYSALAVVATMNSIINTPSVRWGGSD